MRMKLAGLIIVAILTAGSVIVPAAPSTGGNKAINSETSAQLGQILFPRNRRHHHNHRWNNNGNVRYETVTVHRGYKVYRDTYKITYKNGHEKRKRVEHVRVA